MKRLPLILAMGLLGTCRIHAQSDSFVVGSKEDEAAIREIVRAEAADESKISAAPDLDWENAFGVRYTNLAKRNKFFERIRPQFKDSTDTTLEVKVRFVEPTVAVADEYWHVVGQVYAGETKPAPDRWGRNTYILKKENGVWIEVLSRIADLRDPYYKHYDAIPKPVPVPTDTLATYAGTYAGAPGKSFGEVILNETHLSFVRQGFTIVLIPTSPTEFLAFPPNDLEGYYKVTFGKDDTGRVTIAAAGPDGKPIANGLKAK